MSDQMIFKRYEMKYLLSRTQYRQITESFEGRMLLSYDRAAFYAMDNPQFRITFDENILWRDHDVTLTTGIGGTAVLPADTILMEVKTADAIPLWLVQLLSREKIYKTSFSKYGTAWLQKQRRF